MTPTTERRLVIKPGSAEWHQLRKRAREDLYWFNAKVLGHEKVVPMSPRAHYAMCRFAERKTGLQRIDECRVQLIQVPRGVGKTTLITKGRTLQRLIQQQDWAAGIANEIADNASAFLAMIKAEFESNEFLQALFPECIPNFRQTEWRSDRIVINRTRPNPVNPSVLAAGANATVTGVHMNEWIIDDLISQNAEENARAGIFTEVEKAQRWCERLHPLLQNPERDPLTFVGTPYFVGDLYDWLVNERYGKGANEEVYDMLLELPDDTKQVVTLRRQGDIAIFKLPAIDAHGKPLFPERYDLAELDAMRRRDPVRFSSQYMLNPAAESAAFKPEWLREFHWEGTKQIHFKNNEGRVEYARLTDMTTIISVDPAISRNESAARSAICVVGCDGRRMFLLEAWADRVGVTELATKVIELYRKYPNTLKVVVEFVAYQEALAEVLDLLAEEQKLPSRLPIYEHRTGPQLKKEVRILGLEPFFRKGLFYFNNEQRLFHEEYCNFPHIKQRDILDALSFQKDIWESLSNMSGEKGGVVKEWKRASAERVQQIRDRFQRRR